MTGAERLAAIRAATADLVVAAERDLGAGTTWQARALAAVDWLERLNAIQADVVELRREPGVYDAGLIGQLDQSLVRARRMGTGALRFAIEHTHLDPPRVGA